MDDKDIIVIYKYQDPVVRMICELVVLVLDGADISIDKYYNLSETFEKTCDDDFNSYISSDGLEGSKCKFGIGLVTCCSSEKRFSSYKI